MRLSWRSRRGAGAVLGLLVAVLLVWAVAQGRPGPAQGFAPPAAPIAPTSDAATPRVGMIAPDFQLTDVNTGQPLRLSALRGRPVWINFWATWCEECKAELPVMKQLYDKYKSRGLALVGVDLREDPAQVQAFTRTHGYDWFIVMDADIQVRNRYATVGIPNHVFVDAQGIIQAISLGHLPGAAMEEDLAKIIDD